MFLLCSIFRPLDLVRSLRKNSPHLGIDKPVQPRREPADARQPPSDDAAMQDAYWAALLKDPRAETRDGLIQNRRLREITRDVLRVSCRRCSRIVEIGRTDALRLYGGQAIWRDVGHRLLDRNCEERTGNRDDDGCWPTFS